MIFFKPNPHASSPIYAQLLDQARHAIEVGALRPGDQLPPLRKVAEDLALNPNTIAKVYRELEHEGLLELRQGSGAYVTAMGSDREKKLRQAQGVMQTTVRRLTDMGLYGDEIRRLLEAQLRACDEFTAGKSEKKN